MRHEGRPALKHRTVVVRKRKLGSEIGMRPRVSIAGPIRKQRERTVRWLGLVLARKHHTVDFDDMSARVTGHELQCGTLSNS